MYRDLDNDLQFRFLLNSIRPKKRFSKWAKTENTDVLDLLTQYFECSLPKAKEYLTLLTEEQLDAIRECVTKGKEQ